MHGPRPTEGPVVFVRRSVARCAVADVAEREGPRGSPGAAQRVTADVLQTGVGTQSEQMVRIQDEFQGRKPR